LACDGHGFTFHWLTHDAVMKEIETVNVVGSRYYKLRRKNCLGVKLYVNWVRKDIAEDLLWRLFSFYGTVKSLQLARDIHGTPIGTAIVEMSHPMEVQEILCTEDRLYGDLLRIEESVN